MWPFELFFKKKELKKQRVLFLTKSKNIYGEETSASLSTGLSNSVKHTIKCLEPSEQLTIELKNVIDNNCIDREVTAFKPTIVIIEAMWVVPSKFEVLKKLHPNVKWIIRLHSKIPFISGEGIALDWIGKYIKIPNVYVAANSTEMLSDLQNIFKNQKAFVYLPNMYYTTPIRRVSKSPLHNKEVHIGCFGALRPLKNQLAQAAAAIRYADNNNLKLYYYINTTRKEGFSSENILKNIRSLFLARKEHVLKECEWMSQGELLNTIPTLDLGLQVSFSETFNMVTADFVSSGVPVVVSPEIFWVTDMCKVKNITATSDIERCIKTTLQYKEYAVISSNESLLYHNKKSRKLWDTTLDQF